MPQINKKAEVGQL